MGADFGAHLDAALNASLERVRAAAADAKARIEEGHFAPHGLEPLPDLPMHELPPLDLPPPKGPVAAVSFDLDESDEADHTRPLTFPDAPSDDVDMGLDMDDEGIPLPEDIPPLNG